MSYSVILRVLSVVFFINVVSPVHAAVISDANASVASAQLVAAEEYTFSSPPREKSADGGNFYQPIAELLTKATGKKFIYKNPDNWLAYQSAMRKGTYDVVFDGPHFVSWRIQQMGHTPLLKLPQPLVWVVITKQGSRYTSVKELAGRGVCVHASPNFGTLTLLSLFDNPARQPHMVEIKGWDNAYKGVAEGKCEATILPLANYKKFDQERKVAKIIYQHQPYPNQAFTAGTRVSSVMRDKIVQALMSEEGKIATKGLRDTYAKGEDLIAASKEEYANVALVLKTYWGFEF